MKFTRDSPIGDYQGYHIDGHEVTKEIWEEEFKKHYPAQSMKPIEAVVTVSELRNIVAAWRKLADTALTDADQIIISLQKHTLRGVAALYEEFANHLAAVCDEAEKAEEKTMTIHGDDEAGWDDFGHAWHFQRCQRCGVWKHGVHAKMTCSGERHETTEEDWTPTVPLAMFGTNPSLNMGLNLLEDLQADGGLPEAQTSVQAEAPDQSAYDPPVDLPMDSPTIDTPS